MSKDYEKLNINLNLMPIDKNLLRSNLKLLKIHIITDCNMFIPKHLIVKLGENAAIGSERPCADQICFYEKLEDRNHLMYDYYHIMILSYTINDIEKIYKAHKLKGFI